MDIIRSLNVKMGRFNSGSVFKSGNHSYIQLPGIHENTGCSDPLFMLVFVDVDLILSIVRIEKAAVDKQAPLSAVIPGLYMK